MNEYLPKPYTSFVDRYPDVARAYEQLGEACGEAGPLDVRTRHLVQLGIAVAAEALGAVKSHARRALELGVTENEVRHAVVLSLPTVGSPAMIAAMGWVNEVIEAGRDELRRERASGKPS